MKTNTQDLKVLFLDRDGVINLDHGYTYKIDQFEFIDGVFDACKMFADAGYQIIVITNQSGIARGYYTEDDFWDLTEWMLQQFNQQGIEILDVYFCPHHPTSGNPPYKQECECRKPEPGMLLQAFKKYPISSQDSILVGDKQSDMEVAINANVGEKYLVTSGQSLDKVNTGLADGVYPSLLDLAKDRLL